MIIEESGYTPTGHYYMIVVLENLGFRNGYVGVKSDSKLFMQPYYKSIKIDNFETQLESVVSVHGGLTYSGNLGYDIIGGDNYFFYGFDCGHAADGRISIEEMTVLVNTRMHKSSYYEKQQILNRYKQVYAMPMFEISVCRTNEYVKMECYSLSKQLTDIESKEILLIDEIIND